MGSIVASARSSIVLIAVTHDSAQIKAAPSAALITWFCLGSNRRRKTIEFLEQALQQKMVFMGGFVAQILKCQPSSGWFAMFLEQQT